MPWDALILPSGFAENIPASAHYRSMGQETRNGDVVSAVRPGSEFAWGQWLIPTIKKGRPPTPPPGFEGEQFG